MSNDKKIKLALTIITILVAGWFGATLVLDFTKYHYTSKRFDELKLELKNKGFSNIKKDTYCRYSSQKYSRGDRDCIIRMAFTDKNAKNTSYTQTLPSILDLTFKRDNTLGANYLNDDPYASYVLYQKNGLDCSISSKTENNNAIDYRVDCHGAAKMEYFPVRE